MTLGMDAGAKCAGGMAKVHSRAGREGLVETWYLRSGPNAKLMGFFMCF